LATAINPSPHTRTSRPPDQWSANRAFPDKDIASDREPIQRGSPVQVTRLLFGNVLVGEDFEVIDVADLFARIAK
jgi:hypothetical protein